MIDRNVEFPNRFQLQKVQGTDDIYDIIPAPGDVIAPGDLFSKGNMLPDEIVSLLGLKMANPQVKDALNVLANVGNLHVWERVLTTIDASYVERRVNISDANIFSSDYQSSRYYARFNVSDSINITSSGDISLVSPTQVEIYFQNGALYNFDSLKGKYISYVSTASNSSSSFPGSGNIGYISSDAEVSITYSNYYQAKITSGAYKVYSVFVPAETTTDYLTSTDRNAYTEGTVDNTTITYLGQLGNRTRIETGSYVGTKTYGSSNPNTLTFGFEPKIVFVVGRVFLDTLNTKSQLGVFNMLALTDEYLQAGYFEYETDTASSPSGSKYAKKNGNTLSWYSKDSSISQMNGSWSKDVSTYTYFAFA